jgi:type I restriction enzyme S subunit
MSGPQNGIYVPKSRYGTGTPILRIDDFQVDWSRGASELRQIQIDELEAKKYALRLNDLVLNRVNSPTHLGKTLAVEARHLPAVFESNMMKFEVAAGVLPRYLQIYLTSAVGRQRLTQNAKWAVNQASINQDDVVSTLIPLPPLEEQKRIVTEVDRRLSVITGTVAGLRRDLQYVGRLRSAILKWAFAGKLVDQNADDESAEKLFEGIRRERVVSAPAKKSRRRRSEAGL